MANRTRRTEAASVLFLSFLLAACSSDAESSSWTYGGGNGGAAGSAGAPWPDAGGDVLPDDTDAGEDVLGEAAGGAHTGGAAGASMGGTGGTGGTGGGEPLPTCDCYHGNGRYCGDGVVLGGEDRGCSVDLLPEHSGDVLRCTDGTWTVETTCPEGCIVAPPGTPDACKSVVSPSAYYLPWACGVSYTCTQGNNGTFSHTGKSQYAYDFGMARQTPILASRGGVVSHSVNAVGPGDACYDGCSDSACCNACINSGNRVVVNHGDGTSASYLHLDLATAAVGASVTTGTLLGYSGTSGCSYGAHLHFQVMETCGSYYCQSVPMTFQEDSNVVTGSKPVSQNCF